MSKQSKSIPKPEKQEKTRGADVVTRVLLENGVKHVFGMIGGVIVPLVDSLCEEEGIEVIPFQHEQAAAMAAEAYGRVMGLGVTFATSGPGATNLITGINGSYDDSIPTLHLTGQVATVDLVPLGDGPLPRQVGFQETDIVSIAGPITKGSVQIKPVDDIQLQLEKAIILAKEGRPGPVLVDLPIDVQLAPVNYQESISSPLSEEKVELDQKELDRALGMMAKAERPVLIVGEGIRMAGAVAELRALVDKLNWPTFPSWAFADALSEDVPQKMGLFGVYGHRGSNFAVQNSDLVLALGTRLDTRMTSNARDAFAREAKVVVVDIDQGELHKNRIKVDLPIRADAKDFIQALLERLPSGEFKDISSWWEKCREWQDKYPNVTAEHLSNERLVNPYAFARSLSAITGKGDVIVPDIGGNLVFMMQGFRFNGQRLFTSFGNAPMGYALPAAIGVSIALGRKPVIFTIGDGGMQINLQELQTVVNQKLPLKGFVYNNGGYAMIRGFQDEHFGSRHHATSENCPDFVKIARAFGITGVRIDSQKNLKEQIREVLNYPGPVICDVMMPPETRIFPKVSFGNPLEQSIPPLPEGELEENMLIPLWERKK